MKQQLAGQLFDIFSTQEQISMTSTLEKLKDLPNQGTEISYAYTNGFRTSDLIYPFFKKTVIERLQTVLGRELKLTQGMHLKEQHPWGIHTDYVKNDTHPDLAILIPLNTEEINTHTVMFNELCLDHFDMFMTNNAKRTDNAVDLIDNLMSHETRDRLEHVSLNGAYPWTPGSVIYWDRRLLHASDNFIQHGLTQKQALVLFTNHD